MARSALADIVHVEELPEADGLGISLYRPLEAGPRMLRAKLFRAGRPLMLSDVLPLFENMGVQVADERPYPIAPRGRDGVWIYDFGLTYSGGGDLDTGGIRESFQDTFVRAWRGEVDNDAYNRLVLGAALTWREITVLRAIGKYLRQARITYSDSYVEQALVAQPEIARLLVALFQARFDPRRTDRADAGEIAERIGEAIDAVESLDQDQILRMFLAVIQAILRTNYFQTGPTEAASHLSFKLDPTALRWLPQPRPRFEIFVYSPRTEGVHLRGGGVARGGIRWSDRREDFRTEVLGLMKAQMVKNAVIVPVGAKGGFVVKRPPARREDLPEEVVACYQTFIRGLLDLTDNIQGGEVDRAGERRALRRRRPLPGGGRRQGHRHVLGHRQRHRHRGGLLARRRVRLRRLDRIRPQEDGHHRARRVGVREAPLPRAREGHPEGGLHGRGHRRHVGRRVRQRHAALAPHPAGRRVQPPARLHRPGPGSRAELRGAGAAVRAARLDAGTTTTATSISAGGGVYERTAKSIPVSPEAREALGIEDESLKPNELIQALLRAPVELLWNGGIGTYVKAQAESHADAGDKANDGVRVDGSELRAKVLGEGGNLGVTQRGRIEFALAGGSVNTDAIDNSGGVDCSDREVNIKILLDAVVEAGDLTEKQRNELLVEMTDEVAALVLQDNYEQSETLSLAEANAASMVDVHQRFLRFLESRSNLDRELEALPDDEEIGERKRDHGGLTRPELAVLLAYSKIDLKEAILDSDVPEDPYLSAELERYFPAPLPERFGAQMREHRLGRQIVATQVVNNMLHGGGTTFAFRLHEETGAPASQIARAYACAREIFEMRPLWGEIEQLDTRCDASVQIDLLLEGRRLVERGVALAARQPAAAARHRVDGAALPPGRDGRCTRRSRGCSRRRTPSRSPGARTSCASGACRRTWPRAWRRCRSCSRRSTSWWWPTRARWTWTAWRRRTSGSEPARPALAARPHRGPAPRRPLARPRPRRPARRPLRDPPRDHLRGASLGLAGRRAGGPRGRLDRLEPGLGAGAADDRRHPQRQSYDLTTLPVAVREMRNLIARG